MTKDRLEELREAQKFHHTVTNDEVNVVILDGSKSEFYNQLEEILDMIKNIQKNVKQVKKKHSAILTATQTDEKIKYELEDLMADIKKTAIKVREMLKMIEINIEKYKDTNQSRTDLRIIKTQHLSLSRMFVDVMNEYNCTQVDHQKRTKSMIKRQLEITGYIVSDDELEDMLEEGKLTVFTQGILMESQQAKRSLADIEARYADFVKLEKSIHELHSIFMDMAMLIENQGDQIDRIEHHVKQAKESVYQGGRDLTIAEIFFKKYLKKKMCIVICLSFVLLILVIIIVSKLSKLV